MDDIQDLIQQLKENTNKVVEERARSESLFLSIGDGAIATDENGKIQRVNQIALDILGYAKAEVVGIWFPRIVVAQNREGEPINPMDRPITKAILTGKPVTERQNYLTKSGKAVPVMVTVSPVVLNRKPIGAVEVFRDITQESEVDKMKSEFISIASHQLRTPLTAVKTYSHLLASGFKGALNNEQQEFMQIILGSINRMNELIDVLLDVSRIEAGRINLVVKKTNLQQLLTGTINELKPEADKKQIEIEFNTSARQVLAVIDRLLTIEVFANLLSNAIKYSDPKSKITVALKEGNNQFKISVADSGYGIPVADHSRVFTKFFRADNVRQKEPSGSGLGLYMVKQIIENMGGELWFNSRVGKGTTFFFTVPKEVR